MESFIAYIDESGDEGFSFSKGSSEWFVLSAVVTRKSTDSETVKLVDDVRHILNKPPKKPLHFRDLRHEHRVPYIHRIANARLRCLSVCIHKPSIKQPEKFQERYRLYFYATRLLIERISWLCRDYKHPSESGDGSCKLIFSNRSGMSYKEMKEYIDYLRERTSYFDVRIDWEIIKTESILAYSSGKRMGLQIADALAGSIAYAINTSCYGFTENRYAVMLRGVTYNRRGTYEGYGLKFWPQDTEEMIDKEERFAWIRNWRA